ncbi:uncharacterized protein LOC144128064 [Amblyomma americanum]
MEKRSLASLRIVVRLEDGSEVAAHPRVGESGNLIFFGDKIAYTTENGVPILVSPEDAGVQVVTAQPEAPTGRVPLEPAAPVNGGDALERCWTPDRTKFLIELVKSKLQNPAFKTRKAMWEDVATSLRDRFQGTGVTPLQAENKWKTLERAYKRVKYHNSRSGHQHRICDHEE